MAPTINKSVRTIFPTIPGLEKKNNKPDNNHNNWKEIFF